MVRFANPEMAEKKASFAAGRTSRKILTYCMACRDQLVVNEDGTKAVHDADRIDYLERHFAAAKRALDDGVPLSGYFVWSLLDNFEWYFGYAKRFGITYVDYATQERTKKDSFLWYRDFIASRG